MATSMSGGSGYGGRAGRGVGMNMTGGNVIPKGYERGQLSQFTPEQMNLHKYMHSFASPDSFLARAASGDPSQFEEMEAPAWRQFQEGLGQIGNRFSEFAPGAMSAQGGSGFRNTLGSYASNFAQDLKAKRWELQRQAIQDMGLLSQHLLSQRPYEHFLIKKQPKQNWFEKALGIGLPVAGAITGGVLGGPAGAAAGGQFGSSVASGFSGSPTQANYSGIGDLPTKWS